MILGWLGLFSAVGLVFIRYRRNASKKEEEQKKQKMQEKKSKPPLSLLKTNVKVQVMPSTGVTFDDVAGINEAKESLLEVINLILHLK